MMDNSEPIEVYIETSETRTFATALAWPGWSRSGRDEAGALQTLCNYGPRYARALEAAPVEFKPPGEPSAFAVVERVEGDATTAFGAPNIALAREAAPVDTAELERWQHILQASWTTFDAAVKAAAGKSLRKGPRGGGRELERIVAHVRDSGVSYLASLGAKLKLDPSLPPEAALSELRAAMLAALRAAVNGEIPRYGPRGGLRWMPRFFVRRVAWHDLDHAWEIEDRIE